MVSVPNVEGDDLVAVPEPEGRIQALRDMLMTIETDSKEYELISDYHKGNQARPNVPKTARVEVHEIAKRSVMNLMPLQVSIPAQLSFIDGYREGGNRDPKVWSVWDNSSMAAKQTNAFRTALKYGNSFLSLEDLNQKEPKIKLLSTPDTVAFYHDPVNDRFPVYAMTIRFRPSGDKPGLVVYYDDQEIAYYDWFNASSGNSEFRRREESYVHGLGMTPVKRLVCMMDDDGVVQGLVKPMIPLQDRVNQTSFDLMVTQTFSSFKVRWASGMLGDPVYEEDPETGEPIPKRDGDGNQVYRPIPIDQSTWVTTDDPQAKMGTLDETPLEGFLKAFEMAIKHFAIVGQLPPHNLLGSMDNLSADTLVAAMSQTMRFVHMLKTEWGQAIVDLLGLASIQMGYRDTLDGYDGEVNWRDMSDHTLAAVVDALGKAAQLLDVPKRSLWPRIPGVTQGEVMAWEEAADEEEQREMFEDLNSPGGAASREAGSSSIPTPLEAFGSRSGDSNSSAQVVEPPVR